MSYFALSRGNNTIKKLEAVMEKTTGNAICEWLRFVIHTILLWIRPMNTLAYDFLKINLP